MSTNDQVAQAPPGPLAADVKAPDFSLHSTPDQTVSLSEAWGRPLILVFYPADWSPMCGDELAVYNELLPEFHRFNAGLAGISVDGPWCHIAFAHERKLKFPLLSDFEPKGAVARAYGAYRQHDGVAERALFVIDAEGVIRWSYLSPVGVNPEADGVLKALEALPRRRKSHDPQSSRGPAGRPGRGVRPHPRPGDRAGDAGRVRRL